MTEEIAPEGEGQGVETPPEAEGQAKTWFDSADDEVRGYIQNKGWGEDPLKAISAYQELESFKGVPADRLLKLPEDITSDGALDDIYARLGRPDSAEGYELNFPDDAGVSKERIDAVKDLAFKVGASPKQLESFLTLEAQMTHDLMEKEESAIQLKMETEYKEIMSEWGSNAKEREELTRRGLRSVLPEGDSDNTLSKIEEAIGTGAFLKMFASIGDLTREGSIHDPETSTSKPFGYTREQALADRTKLMNDISADKERLALYNTGKGNDLDRMKDLNKMIA